MRVVDIPQVGDLHEDGDPVAIKIVVHRGKRKGGRRTFTNARNEAMSRQALDDGRLYSEGQVKLDRKRFEDAETKLCLVANLCFWMRQMGLEGQNPIVPNSKSGKPFKNAPEGCNPRDVLFDFDKRYTKLTEDIKKLLNDAIPDAKRRGAPTPRTPSDGPRRSGLAGAANPTTPCGSS